MLRKILFPLHWIVGITAGSVLALVGATGALLSFEDELVQWLNRDVASVARTATVPLSPQQLLAHAAAAHPHSAVASLALSRDPSHAPRVTFASREARYIHPYSGHLSAEARGTRFFRAVEDVHRRLAAGEVGKQVVGASTLGLLALCLSGFYLRWPRKRPGTLRHLHATAGTWLLAVYLLVGLTGLYWSYGWYRDTLFALAGAERPVAEPAGRGAADVGLAWRVFQREVGAFDKVTLRFPRRAGQALEFRYLEAEASHDRAYNRLALDPATGAVLRHERYTSLPAGARFMRSIFALHSGSFFGLPGVLAIMLASLCMPAFAVTGWVMYLRRPRRRRVSAFLRARASEPARLP